jgi:hypothetical protein
VSVFARFPRLRVLRLHLREPGGFHITGADDHLDTLTDLTIANLPPRPWGHDAIAEMAPALTGIRLTAGETLWLDGTFGPSVRRVTLTAPTIAVPLRLPTHLDHLSLRLAHGTDQQVASLLDGMTRLRALSLRGTPVSDAILAVFDRHSLGHLDLVDTAVTGQALSRFRADHPETSLLPRTPPFQASDLTILKDAYDQP